MTTKIHTMDNEEFSIASRAALRHGDTEITDMALCGRLRRASFIAFAKLVCSGYSVTRYGHKGSRPSWPREGAMPHLFLLLDALRTDTTLHTLHVATMPTKSDAETERFFASLARVLQCNTTLTTLSLNNGQMQNLTPAHTLAHCLAHGALTHLHLGGNHIRASQGRALASMLRANTCLRELDLRDNRIAEGGDAFAEMLTVNTTLRVLNLSDNWMEYSTLMLFFDVIKTNTTLRELDVVRGNSNGQPCLVAIAHALLRNSTLLIFDLARDRYLPYLSSESHAYQSCMASLRRNRQAFISMHSLWLAAAHAAATKTRAPATFYSKGYPEYVDQAVGHARAVMLGHRENNLALY